MGIGPFSGDRGFSGNIEYRSSPQYNVNLGFQNTNPDPHNFVVQAELRIGNYLILQVHYPDSTNFEGKKIMVYEGFSTPIEVLKATGGCLDPHFENTKISPIARFKPDENGWNMAKLFAMAMKHTDIMLAKEAVKNSMGYD